MVEKKVNKKKEYQTEVNPSEKLVKSDCSKSKLWVVVAVGFIVIFGALGVNIWLDIEERFDGLYQQVEQLESRANELQVQLISASGRVQHTQDGEDAVSYPEDEGGGDYLVTSPLEGRIEALETRLEEQVVEQAQHNTLLAVLLALKEKIHTEVSFEDELHTAKGVSQHVPELSLMLGALEPYASTGVLSVDALHGGFSEIASDVIISQKDNQASGLWDKVKGNLSSVITVRKVGHIEGDTVEAKVARIEYYLEEGKLEEAIALAEGFDGATQEVVAEWLGKAKGTLSAKRVFDTIHGYVMAEKKTLAVQEIQEQEELMFQTEEGESLNDLQQDML